MPRIERRANFRRRFRKLEPDRRWAVERALRRLAVNPREPRLRTHKLGGARWACSYSADGRIVFGWHEGVVVLLDVGTHDDVY
ncbi:MAG TPA: type II toxin-antitoxin system mRNA interferase toxin, RelE/StbE family [Chloroflexota bacterium]|jgi:mRNA-degrading endonuclease YafQ of YafQ-DinJ toxin-antitoxin module